MIKTSLTNFTIVHRIGSACLQFFLAKQALYWGIYVMHVPPCVLYLRSITIKPCYIHDSTSLDFVLVVNMPDLILRHILPIKFIAISLYRKVIKAEYVICCKIAKLINFIHEKANLLRGEILHQETDELISTTDFISK